MRVGEHQELALARETPQGFYLSDGEDEVLLPRGQCPVDARVGDTLEVFLYTDSEDRPIATVHRPAGVVGEFVKLRIVSVTRGGAFLDWGLDKDLFCPGREMLAGVRAGDAVVVKVLLDDVSQRVICSMKLSRFLKVDGAGLRTGQPVKIMIAGIYDDLVSVIIDPSANDPSAGGWEYRGSIFPDEWHEELELGEERQAYVKSVRPGDGKIAISLRPQGYKAVVRESERVIEALRQNGGSLALSDKSSPEEIQQQFGLSKGAFKKLIGSLYKEGRIELGADFIRLKE